MKKKQKTEFYPKKMSVQRFNRWLEQVLNYSLSSINCLLHVNVVCVLWCALYWYPPVTYTGKYWNTFFHDGANSSQKDSKERKAKKTMKELN